METKDLMRGDLIRTPRGIGRVNNIYEYSIFTEDGEYEGEEFNMDDVKPIPLTPEILEKNGFEQIRNVGHFFEDRYEKKIIYNFFCQHLKIISNYDTLLSIEYFGGINLHEFQHALKLCGIDKEIVL